MKIKLNLLFLILLLHILLLSSCVTNQEKQTSSFLGIFDKQVNTMINSVIHANPTVKKTVLIDNEKETKTMKLDSSQWESTFALLKEIKPYDTDYNKKEFSEQHIQLTSKDDVKTDLKTLDIVYYKKNKKINSIKACFISNNALFYNTKIIEITLDPQEKFLEYQLKGKEKVILSDTSYYAIRIKTLP